MLTSRSYASEDEERAYIDPDVCIDCGACIPACPVHAIYQNDRYP